MAMGTFESLPDKGPCTLPPTPFVAASGRHCVWLCQAGGASRSSTGMVPDSMCSHRMCWLAPTKQEPGAAWDTILRQGLFAATAGLVALVPQPLTLSLAVLKSVQCKKE